ncbi:hypothetical protein TNCT_368361 [Trichonephila clavata]|uniref:Transposase n=1 Tax=Trichonephila clavata TaxID=2740835 RepID=A0A8X6G4J3_TRICU|nr:hypothetical protein TNCT_368361 [Trichonephila clavata]
MSILGDLIDKADKGPGFLNHIIIVDEMWCYVFDIQSKRASLSKKSPGSPRSKKFRQDLSKGKVMMEVFDSQRIEHLEFIPEG